MPFAKLPSKTVFYTINQPAFSTETTYLLLHGLGSSSCFYETVTPLLSETTTCIALDYPGSGLSKLDEESPEQSIESLADDAIELLIKLKVEDKVVIVGHSMGGIVASYLAAQYPGYVKGVVLLGPVNPGPGLAPVFLDRIKKVEEFGLASLADSIPKGATSASSTPLQQAFIRSLILGTSPAGYISLCNIIANATKPEYSKIKVPLLILAGKEDKTAALPACESIFEAYGTRDGSKGLIVIENCGHWHCVEASERVAEEIRNFDRAFENQPDKI